MPGLRLTFPKFEINWVNRMQIRFTYDDLDTANRQGNRSSFRIRRFRSKWDGWIYTPNLTYELQVDWVGAGITDTTVGLQAGNSRTPTSSTTSPTAASASCSRPASSRPRSAARS